MLDCAGKQAETGPMGAHGVRLAILLTPILRSWDPFSVLLLSLNIIRIRTKLG